MYCVNCGVKLGDAETRCPLCETVVYHPDIRREEGERLYPAGQLPVQRPRSLAVPIILSTVFLMPMLITLLCDFRLNGRITWSGYVAGALLLTYVVLVLPAWFAKPNPAAVAFCDFLAVGGYLLYINHASGGSWFWGLGFPITAALGVTVTAVILLMRRFPRGGLFIFGGAVMALGLYMPLLEYVIDKSFGYACVFAWSLYPLVALVLVGIMLILLGANSKARQILERKCFI